MDSTLRLIYGKEYVSPDKFLLRVQVEPVNTTPESMDSCIVVLKGDAVIDEEMQRIADFAELITVPLPSLPALVDIFSSEGYGPLVNGDIITISVYPQSWTTYYGVSGDVVVTVINDTDPNNVVVDIPFPAYGRGLEFLVSGNLNLYTDGVANRDYIPLTGSLFLAADTVFEYLDFDGANNMINALESEAQSLVDAMNINRYSGIDTEDYV